MPAVQEWIKQKFEEESVKSVTHWTEARLTREVQSLLERVKKLEEDMAYSIKSK